MPERKTGVLTFPLLAGLQLADPDPTVLADTRGRATNRGDEERSPARGQPAPLKTRPPLFWRPV